MTTTSSKPKPSPWVLGIKYAMIAAIAWLGYSNLRAILDWHSSPVVIKDSVAEPFLPPLPASASLLNSLQDGCWVFADMPWDVRLANLDHGDVHATLNTWPDIATIDENTLDTEASKPILTLLAWQASTSDRLGRLKRYSLDGTDMCINVFSLQTASGEAIVVGRIVWQGDNNDWKLVEGHPLRHFANGAESAMGPPLPEGAQVVASRYNKAGQLLGQLATIELNHLDLPEFWEQAGWSVAAIPGLSPKSPTSHSEVPSTMVGLEKLGDHYVATLGPPSDSGQTVILSRVE